MNSPRQVPCTCIRGAPAYHGIQQAYLLDLARHRALNPEGVGTVRTLQDWRRSSFRAMLGENAASYARGGYMFLESEEFAKEKGSASKPPCLPFCPASVSRQQLYSPTMRLMSLLEATRKYGAFWHEILR